MLNLKEELKRERIAALAKLHTPANEILAKTFIEEIVIPNMRMQQQTYKNSNLFCVTYFICPRGNISYNTRVSIEYNLGDSSIMTSEDVLTEAVCQAEEYGITAYKGHQDDFTIFRFEIRI